MDFEYESEKTDLISTALNKAQAKAEGVLKDAENPFFKSSYAPLENYIEAFRKYYAPEGLSFTQTGYWDGTKSFVCTTIRHTSGQWIKSLYPVNPEKQGPQALGACWTYAKRYDLAGSTGLPTADDDGEGATQREPQRIQEQRVLSKNKPISKPTPEGSRALSQSQLDLLRFRRGQKNIPETVYKQIVKEKAGVDDDTKIPFAKVQDVLGALDYWKAGS